MVQKTFSLGWDGWFALFVFICTFIALVKEVLAPEIILLISAGIFTLTGIITPKEFLQGFSQEIIVIIAMLCIVVRTLETNGVLHVLGRQFFPKGKIEWKNYLTLFAPVSALSAFLNNTPIVLMMIPMVRRWAIEQKKSPSKFLIPLSFAAILGGICTLIGTSTNLIVDSLLRSYHREVSFTFFELGKVGVPIAILGLLYISFIGRYILPDRIDPVTKMTESTQKFTVEMIVEKSSNFEKKRLEEIKEIKNLDLVEIQRSYQTILSPVPDDVILEGDRLVFVGDIHQIENIRKIHGLKLASDAHFSITPTSSHFSEVIITPKSSMIGKTLKTLRFRKIYGASVLAIYRQGRRLTSALTEVFLEAGDTLMILSKDPVVLDSKFRSDFYIIRPDEKVIQFSFWYFLFLISVMVVMILAASFGGIKILFASMGAAFFYIVTQSISVKEIYPAISWDILILIGSAFGFGLGLEVTGVAKTFAALLLSFTGKNPYFLTATIFFATSLLTEFITNGACAIIIFPIAVEAARLAGFESLEAVKAIGVTVAIAASCSFSTPIGYQTNTLVYGPGGYRFSDYIKVGAFLEILVFIMAVFLIPYFWPWEP